MDAWKMKKILRRKSIQALKLTAKAPENGCLEDDPASFWGNLGLFSGTLHY